MRFRFLAVVATLGACHIVSGGDEIEVSDEDGEGNGSSSSNGSEATSSVSTASGSMCPINQLQQNVSPMCRGCAETYCCAEATNCDNSPGCVAYISCEATCGPDCNCEDSHQIGAIDGQPLLNCLYDFCFSECEYF